MEPLMNPDSSSRLPAEPMTKIKDNTPLSELWSTSSFPRPETTSHRSVTHHASLVASCSRSSVQPRSNTSSSRSTISAFTPAFSLRPLRVLAMYPPRAHSECCKDKCRNATHGPNNGANVLLHGGIVVGRGTYYVRWPRSVGME